MSKAALRDSPKLVQRRQSGRSESVALSSMKVAKASLSQMPFHQAMVTRSPNHMWAISWLTTSATFCNSGWLARAGSISNSTSRNVTQPRFSMAPKAKSGMATRSSFPPGYGIP